MVLFNYSSMGIDNIISRHCFFLFIVFFLQGCVFRLLCYLQRTTLKVKLMTEEAFQRLSESLTATPALKKIRKSVLEVMSLNARLIAYTDQRMA